MHIFRHGLYSPSDFCLQIPFICALRFPLDMLLSPCHFENHCFSSSIYTVLIEVSVGFRCTQVIRLDVGQSMVDSELF